MKTIYKTEWLWEEDMFFTSLVKARTRLGLLTEDHGYTVEKKEPGKYCETWSFNETSKEARIISIHVN